MTMILSHRNFERKEGNVYLFVDKRIVRSSLSWELILASSILMTCCQHIAKKVTHT